MKNFLRSLSILSLSVSLFSGMCFAAPPLEIVDVRTMQVSLAIKNADDIEMNIKYTAKVLFETLLAHSSFFDLKVDSIKENSADGTADCGRRSYSLALHDEEDNRFTATLFTQFQIIHHENPRNGKLTHTLKTTFDDNITVKTTLRNFKNHPILKIK